jgi:parallel beta-helix repeat protein
MIQGSGNNNLVLSNNDSYSNSRDGIYLASTSSSTVSANNLNYNRYGLNAQSGIFSLQITGNVALGNGTANAILTTEGTQEDVNSWDVVNMKEQLIKISSGTVPPKSYMLGYDFVGDHPKLYFSTNTLEGGWEEK